MRMKAKSELLLFQMLWVADKVMRPTFRNLNESFEGWAYQNGLLKQVQRLEADGLVESVPGSFDKTQIHRLTEAGRIAALGGRDPETAWAREWDRKWRMFLFDVPESDRSLRRKLTRTLSRMGCGCLQGSVWITPTKAPGSREVFPEDGADCSHFIVLEAESRGFKVDRRMVEAAWDFEEINALYQQHIDAMARIPGERSNPTPKALSAWAKEENEAWLQAVRADPLLPAELLPKGYLGRSAWRKRVAMVRRAASLAKKASDSLGQSPHSQ